MATNHYGIVPPTGVYGASWPENFVLPQGKAGSTSAGGWTVGNEGIVQQTFLGASIRSWSVSAGFGSTSSQLSVDLVNDEYNEADGTKVGDGDDIYHNGEHDLFRPPVVGSPVFFKFGKNFANIEQAYRQTLDDTYGHSTINFTGFPIVRRTGEVKTTPGHYHYLDLSKSVVGTSQVWEDQSALWDADTTWRGKDHFAFGGILQSYIENRGPGGNPLHSVTVVDPREILTNATIILNNYQGTTNNNKNLFNIYGLLEYDVSDHLEDFFDDNYTKDVLTKYVDTNGLVSYSGIDVYKSSDGQPQDYTPPNGDTVTLPVEPPIIGQGFSRRGDNGIPWFRVHQGLQYLFEKQGELPKEIYDAGFGGTIDFRGYKYIVDFGGIPLEKIPPMYFINYDQISFMDLAQELADVISHDLFISLLPIINHPGTEFLYGKNQTVIQDPNIDNSEIIVGIIRIDAIDRSKQPEYFAIRDYLQDLTDKGIHVENQDVGYELANITTDKFVVGGNEVEMCYFDNQRDRNNLQLRRKKYGVKNDYELVEELQWEIDTSLKQQILPFYGFLGKDAVSIPRGFGAYQQILLDTQALNVIGVGNYYVATEIELRYALKGFAEWSKFLSEYSELYLEDLSGTRQLYKGELKAEIYNLKDQDAIDKYLNASPNSSEDSIQRLMAGEYGVTVPRCLFNSDKNKMGDDGYPASPCSPPYGYPLYYKRAQKIGIATGGVVSFTENHKKLISNFHLLKKQIEDRDLNKDSEIKVSDQNIRQIIDDIISGSYSGLSWDDLPKDVQETLQKAIDNADDVTSEYYALVGQTIKTADLINSKRDFFTSVTQAGLDGVKNAKKVHAFLKKIAEENLGKKFLVKIPKTCNLAYNEKLKFKDDSSSGGASNRVNIEITEGPFGFKPQPINAKSQYDESSEFTSDIDTKYTNVLTNEREVFNHYLDVSITGDSESYSFGALKNNYNTISEKWEFNYTPFKEGGFFNYKLFNKNVNRYPTNFDEIESDVEYSKLPLATRQGLAPLDLSKIIHENGRVKCYVRYNHAQYLDMNSVPSDKLTQESKIDDKADFFVPDYLEELDNTNPDYYFSTERIKDSNLSNEPKIVSFVTCDVDDKLYLTPKIEEFSEFPSGVDHPDYDEDKAYKVRVFGRQVMWVPNERPIDIDFFTDPNGKVTATPVIEDHWKIFSPATNIGTIGAGGYDDDDDNASIGGGFDGELQKNKEFKRSFNDELDAWIVDTKRENLDHDHVYALITVPARIRPVIDGRYLQAETLALTEVAHNLTQDVVNGAPGFDKPASTINGQSPNYDCNSVDDIESVRHAGFAEAVKLYRDARSNALKGLGNRDFMVSASQPSPVYPDMVAIPLLSNERCYGPWKSSSIAFGEDGVKNDDVKRYSDIGGGVEFVKDENLAPWNFAGYQLMNEAGSLQAQFSNSLLLFSERGGFVLPTLPVGISLAAELKDKGPLVTNVSMDISPNGIKTTVKMDLYTSRFGKLQKQKEQLIAKVSRERQKIIDQNNKLVRQSYFKSSLTKKDLFGEFLADNQEIIEQNDRIKNLVYLEMAKNNQLTFDSISTDVEGVTLDENGSPTAERTTKSTNKTAVRSTSAESESDREAGNPGGNDENNAISLPLGSVVQPAVASVTGYRRRGQKPPKFIEQHHRSEVENNAELEEEAAKDAENKAWLKAENARLQSLFASTF